MAAKAQLPCEVYDPEMWWPLSYTQSTLLRVEEAKSLCRGCPIRMECLAGALEREEREGIWGGYDPEQRRKMTNRRTRSGQLHPQVLATLA